MLGAQYFFVAALVIAVVAAGFDWRTGHIPNWLTIVPLCVAPFGHLIVGWMVSGRSAAGYAFLFSILGAVACVAVPLLLFQAGGIHGGDVKLLAAIGALCRTSVGIRCELYAFIVAALYAPARLAYEGKLFKVLGNTVMMAANPFLPKARRRKIAPEMMTEMRFGPAVAVGTAIAIFLSWRGP